MAGETDLDLNSILAGLESPDFELKETIPGRSDLAKTVCAFANGRGGRLLIGIRDKPRVVVGLVEDELFDFETRIAQMVSDRVEPLVVPTIAIRSYADKHLLDVRVYPGSQTPYYLARKGKDEGTYIRVGSTNKLADRPTIQELERRRLNISYDSTPVYNLGPEAITEQRVRGYMNRREKVRGQLPVEPDEEGLQQIGALAMDSGKLYPTVGGVLLFSREPAEHFPLARIRCARFKGTTTGEFIDEKEIIGPLDGQVEQAMHFFQTYNPRSAKIEGLYREEREAYPSEAVREALVNAVCHRDYNQSGSDTRLAIFDDRLEIISPGALPVGVSLDTLGNGASEARNRVIARFFRDLGLIEQWGQGIARMRQVMAEQGLAEPEFTEVGLAFKVIFRLAGQTLPIALRPKTQTEDPDLTKVIAYLKEKGRVKAKEIMAITGKSSSHTHRKINDWKAAGLIDWKGKSAKDPTGYYILTGE